MKKLQKIQLIGIQSVFNTITPTGIAPEKVIALMKLHRRIKAEVDELEATQAELIKLYGIQLNEDRTLDKNSEHFDEYAAALGTAAAEVVDLSDVCVLSEDEMMEVLARTRLPISAMNEVVDLLKKDDVEGDHNEKPTE